MARSRSGTPPSRPIGLTVYCPEQPVSHPFFFASILVSSCKALHITAQKVYYHHCLCHHIMLHRHHRHSNPDQVNPRTRPPVHRLCRIDPQTRHRQSLQQVTLSVNIRFFKIVNILNILNIKSKIYLQWKPDTAQGPVSSAGEVYFLAIFLAHRAGAFSVC